MPHSFCKGAAGSPIRSPIPASLLLCLALSSINVHANDSYAAGTIRKDRHYLEADCPQPGIQEILLAQDHRFRISSFFPNQKKREKNTEGHWKIEDEILVLSDKQQSMRFMVKSRVHSLVGEKFLYLSFKAIPSPQAHFLDECEFVDRRVLTHFLGSGRKNSPENTD